MKRLMIVVVIGTIFCGPAFAGRRSIQVDSGAGQGPQTLTAEPGPGMHMREFQVFYVDDKTCPPGQIKKWTAGSKRKQIAHTVECITR